MRQSFGVTWPAVTTLFDAEPIPVDDPWVADPMSHDGADGPVEPDHGRRRAVLAGAVVAVLGLAAIAAIVTDDQGESIAIATVDDAGTDVAAAAPVDVVGAAALPDLEGELGQNQVEPTAPVEKQQPVAESRPAQTSSAPAGGAKPAPSITPATPANSLFSSESSEDH